MSDMSLLSGMEPLSRKPVAERVANRLLDLIRSGNLKAGDKLPTENELAAAFRCRGRSCGRRCAACRSSASSRAGRAGAATSPTSARRA